MPGAGEPVDVVRGALERIASRGVARVELRSSINVIEVIRGFPGGWMRWPLERVMKGREELFRRVETHQVGALDFRGHRWTGTHPDLPAQAGLIVGNRRWTGASGTPVASLSARWISPVLNPVWLFDLVRGVTEARAGDEEVLGGLSCRRLSVRASLSRANQAAPYDMALKVAERNEVWADLERIPAEVWVDAGGGIRRLRYEGGGGGHVAATLDVLDSSRDQPVDWSRLT